MPSWPSHPVLATPVPFRALRPLHIILKHILIRFVGSWGVHMQPTGRWVGTEIVCPMTAGMEAQASDALLMAAGWLQRIKLVAGEMSCRLLGGEPPRSPRDVGSLSCPGAVKLPYSYNNAL